MRLSGFILASVLFVVVVVVLSSCTPSTTRSLSADDAERVVSTLPETRAFQGKLEAVGRQLIIVDETEAGSQAFQFYVGEDVSDHTVLWNRFRVDRQSGVVLVWEPVNDQWLSVVEWRTAAQHTGGKNK
jgi:hypothetical protein